jgi:hypothetical protein
MTKLPVAGWVAGLKKGCTHLQLVPANINWHSMPVMMLLSHGDGLLYSSLYTSADVLMIALATPALAFDNAMGLMAVMTFRHRLSGWQKCNLGRLT